MRTPDKSNGAVAQVNEGEFDAEVLRAEMPVLVDFYADWCGPCKMVTPTLEALAKEYKDKVKFVKVDVDMNHDLASRYEIMSIPTAMLFDNGTVKDSVIGAYPAAAYRHRIDRVISS